MNALHTADRSWSRSRPIRSRLSALLLPVLAAVALVGCGNRLKGDVAPDYLGKQTGVSQLGITGGGTSAAIPAFQKAGYKVIDLGTAPDANEKAAAKNIPFVAAVDAVGTDGAWWDGFFDFSMRVTETKSHQIVWSATAEYGQGGMFINQTKSTDEAMRAMVADFAKSFPPTTAPSTTGAGTGAGTGTGAGAAGPPPSGGPLKPIVPK